MVFVPGADLLLSVNSKVAPKPIITTETMTVTRVAMHTALSVRFCRLTACSRSSASVGRRRPPMVKLDKLLSLPLVVGRSAGFTIKVGTRPLPKVENSVIADASLPPPAPGLCDPAVPPMTDFGEIVP